MTQRNSRQRAHMLLDRRFDQLSRVGGGKLHPVYRTSPKWRKPAKGFNCHVIAVSEKGRLHATKGWRPFTEYELVVDHG